RVVDLLNIGTAIDDHDRGITHAGLESRRLDQPRVEWSAIRSFDTEDLGRKNFVVITCGKVRLTPGADLGAVAREKRAAQRRRDAAVIVHDIRASGGDRDAMPSLAFCDPALVGSVERNRPELALDWARLRRCEEYPMTGLVDGCN